MRTAIFVDCENIRLSGGWGMRYDRLTEYAECGGHEVVRANAYIAEDLERAASDANYKAKIARYFAALRSHGFKLVRKTVRHFREEDGTITTKANADMELAVDALLQSVNVDRVILCSGDGDFVRLVSALQDQGRRVEVIAFDNVSMELQAAADVYRCGFLIDGLIVRDDPDEFIGQPIIAGNNGGYGFLRRFVLKDHALMTDTTFVHHSALPPGVFDQLNHRCLLSYKIEPNPLKAGSVRACNINIFRKSAVI
jgi:uncharacterized LabA/DUF88 family protein